MPTRRAQVETAIKLLGLKKGQTIIDIGSGDGVVLKVAAQKGIKGVGYELNPIMWLISKIRLRKYKDIVRVELGDFWTKKLPKCDGVFLFLTTPYMKKMEKKLVSELKPKTKVASYAFEFASQKPIKMENAVYLYEITKPAKM